jgi:hypothetical protein
MVLRKEFIKITYPQLPKSGGSKGIVEVNKNASQIKNNMLYIGHGCEAIY